MTTDSTGFDVRMDQVGLPVGLHGRPEGVLSAASARQGCPAADPRRATRVLAMTRAPPYSPLAPVWSGHKT